MEYRNSLDKSGECSKNGKKAEDAFLAIGGTLDDLCEDGPTHDHVEHCPFCNTIAQADVIAPSGKVWTLTPDPLLLTFAALEMGEQRQDSQRLARGPPTVA